MLHMLQNQRKASEWSCNDPGRTTFRPECTEHHVHVLRYS
jgi:hypothetical protein